jgi:hypothetical protein
VVDPNDPADLVLNALSDRLLLIWIEGSDAHTEELVRRFDRSPKPMYYRPDFLRAKWAEYLDREGIAETSVDPDAFVRWTYAQALAHRQPLYAAMAKNWGIKVRAEDVAGIRDADGFSQLVAQALEAR